MNTQMQQTASSAKIQSEISKKVKKLNSTRNNAIQQRASSKPFTRLKSNHETDNDNESSQSNQFTTTKPRSSMGRRPASSHKHTETMNSLATTTSAKSEGEVKQIIHQVFGHSKKLNEFIAEKSIDNHEALASLLNNELFTLSLMTMLSNKSSEEASKYVEKSCISKLERMIAMEKQKQVCENIESKISSLIDRRIKALSHY